MGFAPLASDVPLDGAQPRAQQQEAPPASTDTSAPVTAPSAAPTGFAPLPEHVALDGESHPQPVVDLTDDEKRLIQDYIPKAKDAADLAQFAHEATAGRATVQNPGEIIKARDRGNKEYAWHVIPGQSPKPATADHPDLRDKIGESMLDAIDNVAPGAGQFLRDARDNGSLKAYLEHTSNAAAADFGPEVGGFFDTAGNPSQYGNFSANLDRNVAHERAQIAGDSEGHPFASVAGELTGAGLTAPIGGEALDSAGILKLGDTGVEAGTTALRNGASMEEARAAAAAAARARVVTGAGRASLGASAYGAGSAGPGNRVAGAVVGAGIGAATDVAAPYVIKAIPAAGKAVASVFSGSSEANHAFDQAAQRQGVDYMAADLPKSLKSKFATALTSLSFGAIPLAKQGEKNIETAANAAGRVTSGIGTVSDRTGAGMAAQQGARQFVSDTADTLDSLETKIPVPSDAPAVVSNTRTALSNLAQSFSSNAKLAEAFRDPKISAYLDALTPQTTKEATGVLDASGNPITRDVVHGGGLSWNDLRDFRSRVGQIIGKPGLSSDGVQIGQLRALYGSLSDDIKATAQQFGPKAENAWNRWNNYARARSDRIDNVVSLILGKNHDKGPQSAFEALQGLANEKGGDPLKLARALRSMPDDESNSVRATILDGLGDANPGQQNGVGDVFSPAQWVTNWNKLSDRAKNVLFTGPHRDALNDLATVFSGMKSSSKFANSSKTGISVVASANAGLIWAHPVLGSLAAALEVGGGKLLASPAFARKVAGTPMNVAGAKAFWSRPWVNAMAAKNPAIAGEINAFQSAFLHANDNQLTSVAASPNSNSPSQNEQANGTQP